MLDFKDRQPFQSSHRPLHASKWPATTTGSPWWQGWTGTATIAAPIPPAGFWAQGQTDRRVVPQKTLNSVISRTVTTPPFHDSPPIVVMNKDVSSQNNAISQTTPLFNPHKGAHLSNPTQSTPRYNPSIETNTNPAQAHSPSPPPNRDHQH